MNAKNIRDRLGMTRSEFARVVGVSQASVSRWEAGIQHPNYHAAKRIAAMVDGVTVDDLVRAA